MLGIQITMGRPTKEIVLTDEERDTLQQWVRRAKTSQRLALRAHCAVFRSHNETKFSSPERCFSTHNGMWGALKLFRALENCRKLVYRWRDRERMPDVREFDAEELHDLEPSTVERNLPRADGPAAVSLDSGSLRCQQIGDRTASQAPRNEGAAEADGG